MNVVMKRRGMPTAMRLVVVGLLIAVVGAGLWFRFVAMDRKYFWLDEVHAALLRSGHSEADLYALFDNQPRRLMDLQRYAEVNPQQPFMATAETLASHHPVHPPLYYLLLRAWTEVAGPSIGATRALSALFSVLCFPAVYWLAKELFRSRTAAWTAVALWSVSPMEVLYAQEAKQYSMFAATLMFAAAALLRAVRVRTFGSWCTYAVAASLALYTHMLFAPVLATFGMFLFLANVGRLRQRRTWKLFGSFAAATSAALISFVPWIVYCLTVGEAAGRYIAENHMSSPQAVLWLIGSWISNVSCTFADLGFPSSNADFWGRSLVAVGVLALVGYSFHLLRRRKSPKAWLFLALVSLIPPSLLIAPDLVLGGGRSMIARYWMATSIGVLLAVAGALSMQFAAAEPRRRLFAGALLTTLLVAGFISCNRSAYATYWWNKMGVVNNHRNGAIEYVNMRRALLTIERAERPLIITELGKYQECRILSFTYYLNDAKVEWLGTVDPTKLEIPKDRTVYLFAAFDTYRHLKEQGWTFEAIEPSSMFVVARPKLPDSDRPDPKIVEAAGIPSSPELVRSGSQ